MKKIFPLILTLLLALPAATVQADSVPAPTQGVLTSVVGKVQIQNKKKKKRTAKKASTVLEGERIITAKDGNATLQMFDGSQLKISPKTDFQVTKVERPTAQDKVLRFKLFVGRIFADVKKLASSRSTFEVEAGGVVCGVRGTQFGLEYDPATNHVGLGVFEGVVYTHYNGGSHDYGAGQNANFDNGLPSDNGNGGSGGKGGAGQGAGNNGGNGPVGQTLGGSGSLADMGGQFLTGLSVTGGDDGGLGNGQGDNGGPGNGQGDNGGSGGGGKGPKGTGGLAGSEGNGLLAGKSNGFADPGVEGSVHLGVQIYIAPGETVP